MITKDKVMEIFCWADDFCKFFDDMMTRDTIRESKKCGYHRNSTMSKAEIMLMRSNMKGALMSVSGRVSLRKRVIIETVNDELKNIAQIKHSRHRAFHNFVVNLLSGIAAYCLFPKKPTVNIERSIDNQLALF